VDLAGSGLSAIVAPLRKELKSIGGLRFGGKLPAKLKGRYQNLRAALYGEAARWIDPGLELVDSSNPNGPREATRWVSAETADGRRRWQRAFTLPDHAGLRSEVQALIDELSRIPRLTDGEGRMYLPPKDQRAGQKGGMNLRQMLGHSPDRSDALCLALWRMRRHGMVAGRPLIYTSGETEKQAKARREAGRESLAERLFGAGPLIRRA